MRNLSIASMGTFLLVLAGSSQVPRGNVINVSNMGAQGTGTVDDSAAIQRAVNSASGKTVFVPPGSYRLDRGIVIRTANVILQLDNSAVLLKNANGALITVRAPQVTIEGGTLDGQRANGFAGAGITASAALLSIRSVKIVNQGGPGIYLRDVDGFTLEGNHLSGNAKGGIFGEHNIRRGIVTNNEVENLTVEPYAHAIAFHSTLPGSRIQEIAISANHLTTDAIFCIEVGAFGGERPQQITVGPQNICQLNGTAFGAISFDSVDHSKVFDNTIESLGTKSHLGVEVVMSQNVVVSGNTIDGRQTLMTGVALTGSSNCQVQKNVITGCSVRGIGLYAGGGRPNADDNLIEGNRITLAPSDGKVAGVQIEVVDPETSASRTIIRGNQIIGNTGRGSGILLHRASGKLEATDVSGNTFESVDTGIDQRNTAAVSQVPNVFHSVRNNSAVK